MLVFNLVFGQEFFVGPRYVACWGPTSAAGATGKSGLVFGACYNNNYCRIILHSIHLAPLPYTCVYCVIHSGRM